MNRPMSTLAQAVRVRHPLKSVTPKVPTRQSSWISPSDLRGRSIGRLFVRQRFRLWVYAGWILLI